LTFTSDVNRVIQRSAIAWTPLALVRYKVTCDSNVYSLDIYSHAATGANNSTHSIHLVVAPTYRTHLSPTCRRRRLTASTLPTLSPLDLQHLITHLHIREYRILFSLYRTLLHADLQRARQYRELLNSDFPIRHVLAPIQDRHSDEAPIL
jgi:hypothetical protein